MASYRVRCTTAASLVNELVNAAHDRQPGKAIARYGRVDRLGTDVLTGWSRTFTDPRLCAAIVDRLTFNATLIETETETEIETGPEPYRPARTRARAEATAREACATGRPWLRGRVRPGAG